MVDSNETIAYQDGYDSGYEVGFDDGKNSVVQFPFQYMEQFFLGNMSFDDAIENTEKEVYRFVLEYVKKNNI